MKFILQFLSKNRFLITMFFIVQAFASVFSSSQFCGCNSTCRCFADIPRSTGNIIRHAHYLISSSEKKTYQQLLMI